MRVTPPLYPLRARALHPFVLAWFAEIPPERRPSLRVCDVPAGSGILAAPLRAAGFDVTPVDLFPEYMERALRDTAGRGVLDVFSQETGERLPPALRGALFGASSGDSGGDEDPPRPGAVAFRAVAADMEARLPFPDASFDIVLCVEGVEHVQNRHATLAEFRRVLKPGGRLLLTTPNLLSLRARFAYLLAGQRALKSWIDEHTSIWGKSPDGARTYHGHAFLVNYFQVRYSLHHCGFRLVRVINSNWSPTSVLLSPLIPLIALGTWLAQRRAKARFARMQRAGEIDPRESPPYTEMFRHLLSPAMLLNATLIVEAEAR